MTIPLKIPPKSRSHNRVVLAHALVVSQNSSVELCQKVMHVGANDPSRRDLKSRQVLEKTLQLGSALPPASVISLPNGRSVPYGCISYDPQCRGKSG